MIIVLAPAATTPPAPITVPTTTAASASTVTVTVTSAGSLPADSVTAIPDGLLTVIVVLVGLVIVGMFALTLYNLSAPRSTLKNILGLKPHSLMRLGGEPVQPLKELGLDKGVLTTKLVESFGMAARPGRSTTRTTLAVTGFALLGILLVAVLGMSGQGVRDLRSQLVASISTLAAAIAGFYFGSDSSKKSGGGTSAQQAAAPPTLAVDPDNEGAAFTIGVPGAFKPTVGGSPEPTVSISSGTLPEGLSLDPKTGVISGTPATGTEGSRQVTLTASNGSPPDAALSVTIVVSRA